MSAFGQPEFHPQPFDGAGAGSAPLQPAGVFIFGRPGRLDSEESLRSYLLVRAITRSVRTTTLWLGGLVLALGVLCWLAGWQVLGILIGLVGLAVLVVRGAAISLGRRFGSAPADPRLDRLVARTGKGLRVELRRVGLPSAPWAPLLILLRLARRRRRRQTMQSLSRVDLARVVPAGQVDELHLLLQATRRAG
ncbi:MAG TPA: hypothetical protein VHO01_05195 [Jatrophihabitans sp.]|nr:hypothetical protein [Jatrophihabitans sp.]